jgi:single-stranded-DNA-specific exonuclease
MRFRWSLLPPQPLLAGRLAQDLRISPLLAQCLLNRGFSDPASIGDYLDPRLRHLSDPFLLPDMHIAVERLFQAHAKKEPFVIFGDYDVDGVTSSAVLLEVLRTLGWNVHSYLPHRMDEGYGLSTEAAENCLKKFPVSLLLAVDCGSTSVESISSLRQRGVDVIVLDHHQISAPPPPAFALVNPQRQLASTSGDGGASFPASRSDGLETVRGDARPTELSPSFTELCSAGLAFKLAHAIVKRGRETNLPGAADYDLRPLLDLVALGTIADVVPLTGENRILVSTGLERLNTTRRPGLIALKRVAQSPVRVGTHEVGFQLAPRLNAAGRLETAEAALNLLLARDMATAMPLAQQLDAQNRERQKIERGIAEEAIAAVRAKFKPDNDYVIVEGQMLWHIGVVGIVASRVLQQFYRPTIIVGGEGAQLRGSGRSIAGFDLAAALRECGDLLIRHGGHAMAAGISIMSSNLDTFRTRLNEVARRLLKADELQPLLQLDAEVGLDEITSESISRLDRMKPLGQGNAQVQFIVRNLTHQRPLERLGANKQHVKMWLTDGSVTHESVWWGAGEESLPVGKFDLAFMPKSEIYNGRRSVQLKVLDWRAASFP